MPITINGSTGISGVDGSAGTPALQGGDANTGISFGADVVIASTGGVERARVDAGGRLLVGTSSAPSAGNGQYARLAVQGSTVGSGAGIVNIQSTVASNSVVSGDDLGFLQFTGSDGNVFAWIRASADATTGTNDYPGRLVFSTTADGASSPTERMRIASNGQVSITPPASTTGLRVDCSTTAESVIITGTGSNFQVRHPAAGVELFNSSGNAIRVIASSGGVSLAGGGTAWAAISDERKKTDLQPIESGLAKIDSLRAVIGRYKTDELETRRSFLIAQDVQAVLPEAVDDSDPDELGLRYTEVIPLLVAALKESKERIETLEARITTLEAN